MASDGLDDNLQFFVFSPLFFSALSMLLSTVLPRSPTPPSAAAAASTRGRAVSLSSSYLRVHRLAFPAAAAAAIAATLFTSRSPFSIRATMSTSVAAVAGAAPSSSSSPLPYHAEAAAAAAAVRLASKLCERVQATLATGEKSDKEDDSPVTVADYGAQALVAFSLTRNSKLLAGSSTALPFSMVAEEDSADLRDPSKNGPAMTARITQLVNEVLRDEKLISGDESPPLSTEEILSLIDLGNSAGGSEGRHWVLDPIDGTRGFVGKRQYAVCLALLDAGKLAVGVLGCPNVPSDRALADGDGGPQEGLGERRPGRGALFWGTRGGGAYVQPLHDGEGLDESTRLSVSRAGEEAEKDRSKIRFMESFDSRHSDFSTAARLAAALGVTSSSLRLDSQAKYGCLARGDAAINLRFPRKVRVF